MHQYQARKWDFRRLSKFLVVFYLLLYAGCAQVPKESVVLSTTIGRDLAAVHEAHRELARILFGRLRHDINRFVDEVYAPYQIHNAMSRQKELATSPNPDDKRKSLLLVINAAFQENAPPQLQDAVLKGMDAMVRKIREDVESIRRELLGPLNAQEIEVMGSIDRAYQQLHYANSIVTGHLSSVRKVHETQAELLNAFGVERDLRKVVGENLSNASDRIIALVKEAEKADAKLLQVEEIVGKIKDEVNKIKEVNKI